MESSNNIGDVLLQQEKSGEALNYFYSSQGIAEEVNDSMSIARSLNNISRAFRQEKKYKEELLTRAKLLDINKKMGNYEAQSTDNLEIGNIYMEENKLEEAIPYFEESIELSNKTGNFDNKKEALQKLYITQEKSGNFIDAFASLKEYIATLELKYEHNKKK